MPVKSERKPYARPPRAREEIERDRQTRKANKEARKAKLYANSEPLFSDVGIVTGTTPRGRTHADDVKQSVQHVRAMDRKRDLDLKRLARVMSDKPADVYDTIEEQAGFNDWSRSWWRQAVPSHPAKQQANAVMKTRSSAQREAFTKNRTRNMGVQAPTHP